MKKMEREIYKLKEIYGVVKNEVEIASGSKNSIDKELAYDLIR